MTFLCHCAAKKKRLFLLKISLANVRDLQGSKKGGKQSENTPFNFSYEKIQGQRYENVLKTYLE
jgi:hypothetical protein